MTTTALPVESPLELVANAAQIILAAPDTLGRGKHLNPDDADRVKRLLLRAMDQMAAARHHVAESDALPLVAWGTQNFGTWHRQTSADVTRCGVHVPVTQARACYRNQRAPRPDDFCEKCWAQP